MHIRELQVRMFYIGDSWQQRGRNMAVKVRNGFLVSAMLTHFVLTVT